MTEPLCYNIYVTLHLQSDSALLAAAFIRLLKKIISVYPLSCSETLLNIFDLDLIYACNLISKLCTTASACQILPFEGHYNQSSPCVKC